MTLGVVPDDFALTQRLAEVQRTIEQSYSDRMAGAEPGERKQLLKQMKKEIGQAIKEEIRNTPWWEREGRGPWIR